MAYDKWAYRREPGMATVSLTAKVAKVYKDGSIRLDNDWRFTKHGSPYGGFVSHWRPRLVRPSYAEKQATICRVELDREAKVNRLYGIASLLRHRPHEFSPGTHPDEMRELLDQLFPKEPAHAPE